MARRRRRPGRAGCRAAAALRRPARPKAARLRLAGHVPRVEPEAVSVVGAGLAGCEAAWQLARRGVPVRLFEMRPVRRSPAHSTDALAELVCSNSLRSDARENAVGLLHEELRRAGSLVLAAADATRVPAGSALAVDRGAFSAWISERIEAEPAIELVRRELGDQLGFGLCRQNPGLVDNAAGECRKIRRSGQHRTGGQPQEGNTKRGGKTAPAFVPVGTASCPTLLPSMDGVMPSE